MKMMIPINIRLPASMIQDVDKFAKNRSQFIRSSIKRHLATCNQSMPALTTSDASAKQLMVALSLKPDVDPTLKLLLDALVRQ